MLKVLLPAVLEEGLAALLKGHACESFSRKDAAILSAASGSFDLVILEGADLIEAVSAADPRAEIIIMGGNGLDSIEAVKKGATACFTLPVDGAAFSQTLSAVEEQARLRDETDRLERLLVEKYTYAGVVARNPHMLEIFRFLRKIAPFYKTVTITGETGTGKEAVARALHSIGPASKEPFIPCNCGGLVENLLESEFFGHVKGAFTGADCDKAGIFEEAGEGVVFLDEIGDLPLSFQPHLLRVLQNGEFRRVGSSRTMKASCRVIAATNKELSAEVKAGRFREDLYFRLTPLTVHVPPLRERKDDVPLLSRSIIERFHEKTGKRIIGISRPAQRALMDYDWPGNVRELEGVVEHAAILASEPFVNIDQLPANIREGKGPAAALNGRGLDSVIKGHIEAVLRGCGGNRSQAARELGISRRALQRKIEKYSLE